MIKLEALIFDVDGTLADTERDGHRIAFNKAFKEFDLDWVWDESLYGTLLSVTGGKERMAYYLKEFNKKYPVDDDTPEMIKAIHKAKTQHYTKLLATGAIPLRVGVKRLINEAREKGMRIAISTTTTPENVTALLEHALAAGSSSWFEVIAAGDIVPDKKPAADIYNWTLEQLDLPADACLAFEDSRNGILSSQGANLKTIITVNGYTKKHAFDGAAIVLDNMGDPDKAFTTISGNNFGHKFLDLDMLEKIHNA